MPYNLLPLINVSLISGVLCTCINTHNILNTILNLILLLEIFTIS